MRSIGVFCDVVCIVICGLLSWWRGRGQWGVLWCCGDLWWFVLWFVMICDLLPWWNGRSRRVRWGELWCCDEWTSPRSPSASRQRTGCTCMCVSFHCRLQEFFLTKFIYWHDDKEYSDMPIVFSCARERTSLTNIEPSDFCGWDVHTKSLGGKDCITCNHCNQPQDCYILASFIEGGKGLHL